VSDRRINGEMVRLARDVRDLTQEQLADLAGVAQTTISKVEVGGFAIANETTAQKIADATKFPIDFFFQEERYMGLGISTIFYRKKSTALQRHIRQLQAEVNLRRLTVKTLIRDVEVKTPNSIQFYPIESVANPSEIARMVRANWKLPAGPITNLTAAIEGAGGIVFRFPFGTADIDAISQWPDDCPPLFFVNSMAPADRIKFSLAHELGHMTMHNSASETMEDEADRFAQELLMPESEIRHQLAGVRDLKMLAMLKPFWRVSIGALLYRAKALECISEHRARQLWIRYTQLGFRKNEPNPLPHELPQLVSALVETHVQQNGAAIADLARVAKMGEADFRLRYLPPDRLRLAG